MSDQKIDFFIIGAPKCGTTSIYEYLNQVPQVIQPLIKEVRIFSEDGLFHDFETNLPGFYPPKTFIADPAQVIGLADVALLYLHHYCAPRIHSYNPDARIIVCLRNPVDRAYSNFWFFHNKVKEKESSFEKVIEREEREMAALTGEEKTITFPYLKAGLYYEGIKHYQELFGPARVKVILLEEFLADKENAFRDLLKFLGMDPIDLDLDFVQQKHNESGRPRVKLLTQSITNPSTAKKFYKKILPLELRMKIRRKFTRKLLDMNTASQENPPMAEATYEKLRAWYADDVAQLSVLLGKDLEKIWFERSTHGTVR